ncbi:hypothetical protein H310_12522 [Aphanomyces invadans]|uniref:Uncharacterized protein n=1 Tax=Aphanomyces invadans TaxID=157072 RepID=A0A024TIQ8_9STRA|nr:hypothetical protein H310_12522 [Aphanomyces invadans]ETV93471.1 hypothetical protein H310_12522 [Aphanomyces invadans]|eukprot:XP_008877813.1 hypothetical protein H310_12522 [Aphanomyces invadans]
MKRSVKFGAVVLGTTCGPLTLRGLHCWIDDTSPEIDLIISRPVMDLLGFSVDTLLVGARQKNTKWDVSVDDEPPAHGMSKLQRMTTSRHGADEPVLADGDGMECATPEVATVTDEEQRKKMRDEVFAVLMSKVAEAESCGLTGDDVERLKALLSKHVDVFRIDLGNDPPVKVEPLKVRIKPKSTPVKCGMRRYPPAHLEYMREHVEALLSNDMVYANNRAPRIVP